MKYSMMTYSMARQVYGVEEIVRTAAELGFDAIDWVTGYGRGAEELRQRSEDAGLPVAAYTFYFNDFMAGRSDWLDEVKQQLLFAVQLGAPLVMIPTPPLPGSVDRIAGRRRWIDALRSAEPLVREAGVVFTIENFPGILSPFVTAEDFFAAREAVPGLELTFDDGNAASGEDMLESYRATRRHVRHVHFKDWYVSAMPAAGTMPMLNGTHCRPALIGDGAIDSHAMLEELCRDGYQGCINLEYEGDDIPAHEAMRRAIGQLRDWEAQLPSSA